MMDELFKALRHFITRDIIFLIGGGCVVASFLHNFDRLPIPNDHAVVYLLLAGISYVVGYTLQDGAGLLRVFPTKAPYTLNPYLRRLYKCYTRESWRDIPVETDFERAEESLNERQALWLERITTLRQIGTAVGPCWFASAGLLSLRYWLKGCCPFELALMSSAALMALILAHLAWLKAAQESQYLWRHNRTIADA